MLERAVLIAEHDQLTAKHLHFQNSTYAGQSDLRHATGTLKQVERAYINLVLQDEVDPSTAPRADWGFLVARFITK